MNAVLKAVDELLRCVADPGYRVDSFTFQPLRDARRNLFPGEAQDCNDPTCGGFLVWPMPDGSLACNTATCPESDAP